MNRKQLAAQQQGTETQERLSFKGWHVSGLESHEKNNGIQELEGRCVFKIKEDEKKKKITVYSAE